MPEVVAHDVKDLSLAEKGKLKIELIDKRMHVLASIRERFEKEKPLAGMRISACLHVTTETANLMRTLKAGGADVVLCASNPLTTQDDVAAALVKEYGISTYAIKGEDNETYYRHINAGVDHRPHMTMDDGADVVGVPARRAPGPDRRDPRRHRGDHHRRHPPAGHGGRRRAQVPDHRRQRRQDQAPVRQPLRHRPVARSTASSAPPTCCSPAAPSSSPATAGAAAASPCAPRATAPDVIVIEVDPLRALEAVMDGYHVMPMAEAAKSATSSSPSPATCTSSRGEHFEVMKDGAIICQLRPLQRRDRHPGPGEACPGQAAHRPRVRRGVHPGRRPAHLPARRGPAGQPVGRRGPSRAAVMDMSFANQALAAEYMVKNHADLENKVYAVPRGDRRADRRAQAGDHGHQHRHAHAGAGEVPGLLERRHVSRRQ